MNGDNVRVIWEAEGRIYNVNTKSSATLVIKKRTVSVDNPTFPSTVIMLLKTVIGEIKFRTVMWKDTHTKAIRYRINRIIANEYLPYRTVDVKVKLLYNGVMVVEIPTA